MSLSRLNLSLIRTAIVSVITMSMVACAMQKTGNPKGDPGKGSVTSDDPLNYVVPDRLLTANDVSEVELSLSGSADDLKPRVDLLWYYRNQFADADASANANSHLLWIVTHHPDAKVLGTPIAQLLTLPGDQTAEVFSKLWGEQVLKHPNNARVQGHAGLFYKSSDSERALRLLEHANALDKNEPLWLENMGDLYASRGKAETVYGKWFDKACDAYDSTLPLLKSPHRRRQLLPKLASVQLHAGKYDEAQKSLDQLAGLLGDGAGGGTGDSSGDESDQAVSRHGLHVLRGLLAIKRGSISHAEIAIADAADALKGQDVSLWQLDMTLADQLQTHKRVPALITYLKVVHDVAQDRTVAKWLEQLKNSKPVDFKDHLH